MGYNGKPAVLQNILAGHLIHQIEKRRSVVVHNLLVFIDLLRRSADHVLLSLVQEVVCSNNLRFVYDRNKVELRLR